MNAGQHEQGQSLQLEGNLIGHENVVRSCIQLFDGDYATASRDKTIRVWKHETWQCSQVLRDHQNWVQDLINVEKYFCSCSDDKKIKLFAKNQRQVSLLTAQFAKSQEHEEKAWSCIITLLGHESYVMRLQYSALNNMIISCSSDGTLKLWTFQKKLTDLKKDDHYAFHTLKGHSNCVYSLHTPADEDDVIISGDEGGELIKWSIQQSRVTTKQEEGHLGCVNFIMTHKNTIVTTGDDKLLKLWDKQLKNVLKQLVTPSYIYII